MSNIKIIFDKFLASKWQPILLLIVIGFLLYSPTILSEMHYLDDNVLIVDSFSKIDNLSYIFNSFKEGIFPRSGDSGIYYRPLLSTSFIIDANIGNGTLVSFHITNIVLHLLSTILVYLILLKLKLGKYFSFIFAWLFMIHPLNLHAIAWIPGRNDPLLTVFFLGTFLSWLHYLKSRKIWQYILVILLYIFSLFTKETALVFPILSLIYLYFIYKEKIFSKFSIINFIALCATTISWLFIRGMVIENTITSQYNIIMSLWQNSPGIISYLGKLIFIHNLSVLPVLPDLPLIFGIIVLLLLLALIFATKKKSWALIIFGALWFLGTLAPSLIKTISTQTQFVEFAEHRVYLSLLGLIIILSQIKVPLKKHHFNIGLVCILLMSSLFIAKNISHTKVYTNKISFWTNAVEYSPNSAFNHNNLGAMYYLDENYTLAEREWLKSSQLNPQEKLVNNNLGLIYNAQGKYEQAYNAFIKELQINPNYSNAHFNLGLLLYETNNIEQAILEWEKTIELDPEYFSAYQKLINHYQEEKNTEQVEFYTQQLIANGGQATPYRGGVPTRESTN
jgi:protein O-mannosyl-transferase